VNLIGAKYKASEEKEKKFTCANELQNIIDFISIFFSFLYCSLKLAWIDDVKFMKPEAATQ
jgi:hypothetical protein